jgi:uncharacterized protein YneF (UPF0154 family)
LPQEPSKRDRWIKEQLEEAPPLTEERVRALLAASGVRLTPDPGRD